MKYKIPFLICFCSNSLFAQWKDSSEIEMVVYEVMNNAESLADSLFWYADAVEKKSASIGYATGMGSAIRLRGLYYEVNGSYDTAMQYYMDMQQFGIESNAPLVQAGALSSQFQIHNTLKQYDAAREKAIRAVAIAKANGFNKQLAVNYSNIGITYRRQKKYDSAFYYYKQALVIRTIMKDSNGISNTNINISSLLIYMEKYKEALDYIIPNIGFHKSKNKQADLWYDYVNASTAYGYMGVSSKAVAYLDSALIIAKETQNTSSEAGTYKSYGEVYGLKGDWKKAYEYMVMGNNLEAETINSESAKAILELEQKFKTQQKEQQNKLLQTEINNQKLHTRNVWIIVMALALIATVSFVYWQQNRNKKIRLQQQNLLINEQNEKLTELNADKNQLISMVSHDLSQPLNNIKIWTEILSKENNSEALIHIKESLQYGQQLIRNVLDVEKAGANTHILSLKKINVVALLKDIADDFTPAANAKNISILCPNLPKDITLMSDKQHLRQILENLISNALKFSFPHSSITLLCGPKDGRIFILVKDEGPGMDADDLQHIFNKYSIAAAKPTAGEESTGLGLHIVKRLTRELGGEIIAESRINKGSQFTLWFEDKNYNGI